MNQITAQNFKPLNTTEVKALTVETKETTITKNQLKKFSVVDLWSIQKNRKPVTVKRAMVN